MWNPRRRTATAVVVTVTGVVAGLVAFGVGTASAEVRPRPTAVTRAGLDPSLVAGRGAEVAFLEQEAENGVTNGAVIGPDRAAYTLPAEASGRKAVQLDPGEWVEFVLPRTTNAITVRYALPDAPNGGGITAPLEVSVDGRNKQTMTLTSQYSWLYNQYPFSNDPNAGLLHPDWWVTECQCVPNTQTPAFEPPTPFRPMHFYDEQRLMLSRTYQAGTTLRLTAPRGTQAAWTIIDLLDSELVGPPKQVLKSVNVVDFGADPRGRRDSAAAFDRAIAFAKRKDRPVYIPPGTFQVNRHIIVDDVTITGAGNWYSIIKGREVALSEPAPDGSVHTGVGLYGKSAADGGSRNVRLSGFAIEGDVRERIDTDQVNGIGGAMSDSTIDGLYIHHTKVGVWFDGPMDNVRVTNNIMVDQIADALNFHRGVTNSVAANNFVRNTGDDGMAMWSHEVVNTNNRFDRNTVQTPTLANGIAIYGGKDITVSGNLVADPLREGSALQLGSRFGATAFEGQIRITDNTTVRAGTYELNWNIGLGALWIYALERTIDADIQVVGDHFLNNTYNALMIVSEFGVKDLYSISNVHFKDIRVDGAGTSVLSARAEGSASFENVDVRNVGWWGVNNCGSFHFSGPSEFSIEDRGGNDGVDNNEFHPGTHWLTPYLPALITCNDRPPVIAPPAPAPW
jgi:hypothetical protein